MKKGLKRKILFISGIILCMALFTSCNINTSNNTISSDNIISENETNNTTLETTIEDNSITTTVDDSSITSNENVNDNTTTSTTSDSGENVNVAEAYTATFVIDSNVKVLVYDTKDMTGEGIEALTAKSKDGNTGEEIGDGSGQINFIVVADEGYYIDNTCISILGTYKNLKTPADTGVKNGYRITKISSDLTITVEAKLLSELPETDDSFSIISENNSNTYILNGYATTGSFTYTYENNILTIDTTDVLSLTLDGTYYGGTITVYSNDDGIHADGILEITGGTIVVENSYEGLEGTKINVSGGNIKVVSKDDGFNSTLSTGSYGITITGGEIYVYAGGDGLDSNTTTSYGGILIDGGKTVVISTSGGNSCIDTEQGYTYKSGYIVAMCPQGMTSECEKVSGGVTKYGKSTTASLTKDKYLVISNMVVIKLTVSISSGYVIELGNTT